MMRHKLLEYNSTLNGTLPIYITLIGQKSATELIEVKD